MRPRVFVWLMFLLDRGRAVIMMGIPFQYTKSHVLLARLEYLQTTHGIRQADFLNFDALRQASQCVGRVIRSKADYGLMIFADKRYNNASKLDKLPPWIVQFLHDRNLSTEECAARCRAFLKESAQPFEANNGLLLGAKELAARAGPRAGPHEGEEGAGGAGAGAAGAGGGGGQAAHKRPRVAVAPASGATRSTAPGGGGLRD